MINLLKCDFYKLKKEKAHLILLIVMLANTLVTFLMMLIVKNVDWESMQGVTMGYDLSMLSDPNMLATMSFFSGLTYTGLFAVLSAGIFISGDFRHRTVNLKVLTGNSRHKVYFSVLISNLLYFALLFVLNVLISLALGYLLFGGFGPYLNKTIQATLLMLPLFIAMLLVAYFIAFCLKNTMAMVINILIIYLLGQIFMLLDSYLSWIKALDFIFSIIPYALINRLPNTVVGGTLDGVLIAKVLVSSAVMGALGFLGGFLAFRKKELN